MQDTITAIYTGDIHKTAYTCGCVWRWWVGKPSPKNHKWEKQCKLHANQKRPIDNTGRECVCMVVGQDDGATTCWQHHNCYNGDCTHMDND